MSADEHSCARDRRSFDYWYWRERCTLCGAEMLIPKTPEERGEPQPPAIFERRS